MTCDSKVPIISFIDSLTLKGGTGTGRLVLWRRLVRVVLFAKLVFLF